MAVTLVEITAFDPVANAAVVLRACNADDHRVTCLNGQRWWPVLARAPQRRLDLFDGDFSGQIGIGIGDLEISTRAHPTAPRWAWGERPVTIWRGPLGGAWGDYVQVFTGLTRQAKGRAGRLQIGLRPDDRWLDKPLLPTYAGTGGAEGPAELKGVAKPLALGAPQFVPGVLINAALNIWQLHGLGSMRAVPVALDRLARFGGPAYTGDDASYAALAAATIAGGAWRTCLAQGLVRFGAQAAVPSFLIEGDNGTAAGWVRRPGAIINRIAGIAGAVSGQIDSASLSALDSWAATLPGGGNISLWVAEQTTARALIQSIAASCNAAAGIGFDGRLFVARAGIGTPAITLAADGSRLPAVQDVELQETSAPFWRMAMECELTSKVHSDAEYGVIGSADQVNYPDGTPVADLQPATPGADNTGAALPVLQQGAWSSAGVSYALGQIVTRDGSSYSVAVAHTSTAGNGPPGANWELVAQAGAQGPTGISAPPVKSLATGTAQFDPIRIANGATITVAAELFLNTGGTTGSCSLELQITPSGAGTWATMTSGLVSDTQPTTEPVELVITGATFTNTSGDARLYDIRAVSVRRSRTVNTELSGMRVI